MTTKLSPFLKFFSLKDWASLTSKVVGVDILIALLRSSDKAVDAAPII